MGNKNSKKDKGNDQDEGNQGGQQQEQQQEPQQQGTPASGKLKSLGAAAEGAFKQMENSGVLNFRAQNVPYLPDELFGVPNLWKVDATRNQIADFPTKLSRCNNLTCLIMHRNLLTRIPPNIQYIKKLQILDLSYNKLEVLCPEIGNCPQITTLILSGNPFREMPSQYSLLDRMSTLEIADTKVETFPPEYTKLAARLEILKLDNTPLLSLVENNQEIVGKNEKNVAYLEVDINKLLAFVCAGGLEGENAGKPLTQIMFEKYDADGSGTIDYHELKDLCYDFGYFMDEDELQLAVQIIDRDASGEIDYMEFIHWWDEHNSMNGLRLDEADLRLRKEAAESFQQFDIDKGGSIDRDEFAGLYEYLVEKGWTKKDLDACLDELDEDGDGEVQFNEYVSWLQANAWNN